MNVVVLGLLIDLSLLGTVNHATMHRNSLFQHSFDQSRNIGFSESIDASL